MQSSSRCACCREIHHSSRSASVSATFRTPRWAAGFSGEHFQRYGHFVQSGVSLLLWETGLLGTGLVFALLAMLFVDAFHVSRGDDFMAAFALGMMGVIGRHRA